MTFRVSKLAGALVLAATMAGTAQAQTDKLHLGPRLSYEFDLEELGLGVQLGVPIARHLEFYPSFDYFFDDAGTDWNLNADLKYRLPSPSVEWLYLGGGLNIARNHRGSPSNNSGTRAGVNVFIGFESLAGRVHPFGEFRFTANNGSTGQLAAGLNFTLRGN